MSAPAVNPPTSVCQATYAIRRQLAADALTLRRLPPTGRRPLPPTATRRDAKTENLFRVIASALTPLLPKDQLQYATAQPNHEKLPSSPWAELLP